LDTGETLITCISASYQSQRCVQFLNIATQFRTSRYGSGAVPVIFLQCYLPLVVCHKKCILGRSEAFIDLENSFMAKCFRQKSYILRRCKNSPENIYIN